jgi:hypothetical protein
MGWEDFLCPSTRDDPGDPPGIAYQAALSDPGRVDAATISYAGRDNRQSSPYRIDRTTRSLADEVVVCDDFEVPGEAVPWPNHRDGTVQVLYADYRVGRLDLATDLRGRLDCLGPGGVPPLDALQNGPVPSPASPGTLPRRSEPPSLDPRTWIAVVIGVSGLLLLVGRYRSRTATSRARPAG